MPAAHWNATVVDSPGCDPFAVAGDLVLAVRTPRSRNFVTVEVGLTSQCDPELSRRPELILSSTPYPCLREEWRGEVQIGSTVEFQVAGRSYRLTLDRLAENYPDLPWVTCDFCVERG